MRPSIGFVQVIRRRSIRIAIAMIAIIVVTLLGSAGLTYMHYQSDLRALVMAGRSSSWLLSQAMIELEKTRAAVAIYRSERSPENRDVVRLRFDILWSRIPLLINGKEAELLRENNAAAVVGETKAVLHVAEPLIDGIERLSDDDVMDLDHLLSSMAEPLRRLHSQAMAHKGRLIENFDDHWKMGIPALAWLTFCATLLASVAYRNIREYGHQTHVAETKSSELANQLAGFESVASALSSGIVVFDRSGIVLFANPIFDQIMEEMRAGSRSEALVALLRIMGSESAATFPEGARNNVFLWPDQPAPTRRELQPTWASVRWRDRDALLLALRDLTDLRQAEMALMRSSQFATLGQMSTAIAHEINQPLAIIGTATRTSLIAIERGHVDSKMLVEKLSRIEQQVFRTKAITDHMRVYGRCRGQTSEEVDVVQCVESVVGFVRGSFDADGIDLAVEALAPPALTWGYRIAIEQAVMNILINARDAFLAHRDRVGAALVVVSIRRKLAGWSVMITDNAGGIDASIIDRIFEPFVTTKGDRGGSGLGLAISYASVKEMGGEITARNAQDGARFEIVFPFCENTAAATSTQGLVTGRQAAAIDGFSANGSVGEPRRGGGNKDQPVSRVVHGDDADGAIACPREPGRRLACKPLV